MHKEFWVGGQALSLAVLCSCGWAGLGSADTSSESDPYTKVFWDAQFVAGMHTLELFYRMKEYFLPTLRIKLQPVTFDTGS